ncbi:UNVERIFIED_ORG: fucose 4-O-acetylase-like acetyltransferase [Pantoea brenneri]|nr:fucose 4-O-acetylase-like acetyltransferase [Pantoea brenneri]
MHLSKEESNALYLVKAIGIIAVVLGHYADFMSVLKPYYFHMPLFFFVGGITLKDRLNVKKLFKSVGTSLTYLIIRYTIIGCLALALIDTGFSSLSNPFGTDIVDSIGKAYFGNMHNNQLFLVAWFLLAYIVALVLCTIIVALFNKIPARESVRSSLLIALALTGGVIAMNIVAVEYQSSHKQIYNLATQSMYGAMFMLIGYAVREFIFRAYSFSALLLLFILTTVITVSYGTTPMVMSWSEYKDGFTLTTLIAMLIIYCVFILANAFSRSVSDSSAVILVGKSTRSIMTWHLSIFILLDLISTFIAKPAPLSSFGVFQHFHNDFSIATYTLAGVLIPTYMANLNVINKIKSLYFKVPAREVSQ